MKKTITLDEIIKKFRLSPSDSKDIYDRISKLQADGFITPVKSSGTNGNQIYPVYKKYRILKTSDEDYSDEEAAIAKLHPALLKSGYLRKHPSDYRNYRTELEALSMWLFTRDDRPLSRKERSYQIFGQEKKLDERDFINLLGKIFDVSGTLNFYDTPEYCFNDFYLNRDDHMILLVCENKDIWFDIRQKMYETHDGNIFGVDLDGVIYGQGNKASDRGGALTEYFRFTGIEKVKVYYWGDIDRTGLDIFLRVQKYNPTIDIELFAAGYRKMLELSIGGNWEKSCDDKNHDLSSYDKIYRMFSREEGEQMKQVIDGNFLIPQEIVNMQVLYDSK